ncbi:MCE family protein [Nocardioides caeni]|uniref:MCE family protein n=1 Tax=Nocardioides caeni TaxID=574700 RepID=A0A4S8NUB1_9ACTN|nr:MCE family protein [Nocardioides caeni]THV18659.1 MCE family protein [Nocardioides caeni]
MNERDPLRVGMITLAILGLIAGFVVWLSFATFGTKEYTAVLEHTAGLRTSEDVEVHGVISGKVTGIELKDDIVLVTFVLDSDIDLGERTTATVKVSTLLGTHYLEVDPGGSGALAGDQIPLERTSVPYNLQDVIESGTEALDELDPELLAEALTAMAGTLGASQEEIGPALEGVARLSEVVASRSDQVGDLLAATREVTDQLSESSNDIVGLMKQTNLVVSEITARRQAIHRLLVETTELSTALTAVVDSTKGKLKPALADINAVLKTLNAQDKQLTNLLEVMGPSLRYLANATGSGPFVPLYAYPPALKADDINCKLEGTCVR